jgi:uncharacterized protein with HEPN domain
MTSRRDVVDRLLDIRDAALTAQRFAQGLQHETFRDDEKTVYAVVRALEIIGEAAKGIPQTVRLQAPEIPWRDMCGIRDKVIHDYSNVDLEIVWRTIVEDLPTLVVQIDELIRIVEKHE